MKTIAAIPDRQPVPPHLSRAHPLEKGNGTIPPAIKAASTNRPGRKYDEWWCLKKTKSSGWDAVIDKLSGEIKTRHYSRKTLKAYAYWCRKFQIYLKDKPPAALSAENVKAYLTYLILPGIML
jgi:hypothetical protein